jgi:hypothetical protein
MTFLILIADVNPLDPTVTVQSVTVEPNPDLHSDENDHDEALEFVSKIDSAPLQSDNNSNNTIDLTELKVDNSELMMEEHSSSPSLFGMDNCGIARTPWEYLGEGGKHALFFFNHRVEDSIANNAPCGKWMGKLLRIAKICLRMAGVMCRINDTATTSLVEVTGESSFAFSSQKAASYPWGDMTLFFIKHVVAPFLNPFVDVPEAVPLTWWFLYVLQAQALGSGRIPSARQSDWVAKKNDLTEMLAGTQPIGMIVVDYRGMLPSNPSISRKSPSYIIELKPKAGYLAFSPLVRPNHRIKYEQSRFKCLQRLQQQGRWTKGWAKGDKCGNRTMSAYEPLDLFSSNRSLIARAVGELWRVSQNNLRVWCNNGSGEILHGAQPRDWKNLLSCDETMLQEILVEILCSGDAQELLQRILQWQKLDVLDVDGAVLIYQRLIDMCQSEKVAQELLDQIQLEDIKGDDDYEDTKLAVPMLELSPYRCDRMPVVEQETLRKFCQTTLVFRNWLTDAFFESSGELPSDTAYLDHTRNVLLEMIQFDLSSMACTFLLRNWLLSLMMCDVSIFMTVEECPDTDNRELLQEESIGNIITISHDNVTKTFRYNLNVIDVDPKPAKKLHGRSQAETAFRFLSRR